MGKENSILARRLIQSYMSSIISISLVLLLVGLVVFFGVNAKSVSDYFKENIRVTAVLSDAADEAAANKLMMSIFKKDYVSDIEYISKEQGTLEMERMLGKDFLDVFETNPVPISLEIFLKADYFRPDSLAAVKADIESDPLVDELVYQESLVSMINSNMERIGAVFAVLIIMLMFISFVLINNTVRLNIYSKRFVIHAMRLVGATKSFIRAPFLYKSVFQGLLAGLLASVYLVLLMYFLRNEFTQLFNIFDMERAVVVLAAVVAFGVALCLSSTFFVVNRMVDMSKDKLYL